MSWGTKDLTPRTKARVAELDDVVDAQSVPDGVEDAFADQLAAAKEAATILAAAVGGPKSKVVVSIGGHANPGHQSNYEGFSDETIHVAVSVAR